MFDTGLLFLFTFDDQDTTENNNNFIKDLSLYQNTGLTQKSNFLGNGKRNNGYKMTKGEIKTINPIQENS